MKTFNTFNENAVICFNTIKRLNKYNKKYNVKIDFEQIVDEFGFINIKIKNKVDKPYAYNIGHICLDKDVVSLHMVSKSDAQKCIYYPKIDEEAFCDKDIKRFVKEFIKRLH